MESPFADTTGLLRALGLFLSGICHQLPGHTLFLGGAQMPLCARCTGTYLGALLVLTTLALMGRSRASRLPPSRVLVVSALLVAFWCVDGLNSYWHFVTGNVLLYTPHNGLRLVAGLWNGLALSIVVLPLLSAALWQRPGPGRPLESLRELGGFLLLLTALAVVLRLDVGALMYPVALADVLSVLVLLGMVNGMIVIVALRWENRAASWRQAMAPLGLGLALAVAEVSGIAFLRAALSSLQL